MNLIERLQELEAKATPGPWVMDLAIRFYSDRDASQSRAIYHLPSPSQTIEVIESPDELHGECIHNPSDHEFIVAIRNALPKLLAVVKAVKEEMQHPKMGQTRRIQFPKTAKALDALEDEE